MGRASVLDHASVFHQDHLVSQRFGLLEMMGDVDHWNIPGLSYSQQVRQDALFELVVHRGEWLIEQE